MSAPRVLAVIPTLGQSVLLDACLDSLESQTEACAVVVVAQPSAERPPRKSLTLAPREHVRVLELAENRGFAGGVNAALRDAANDELEYIAVVNDDVVLDQAWLAALVVALDGDPRLGAVQGINLALSTESPADAGDPGAARIDGVGLAWNRWWQAVQLLHGRPASEAPAEQHEVFGVAATAALFRRAALAAAERPGLAPFDEALFAYYEDADLAGRLRAAGFSAATVPAARAWHRGAATADRAPRRRTAWIYGNRWLVAARLLGAGFARALPRIAARDAADLWRALFDRRRFSHALGIAAGLFRGAWRLPRYLRSGAPLVPQTETARLSAERWHERVADAVADARERGARTGTGA